MRLRIVQGPGSAWEGVATIDDAGIVIEGRGYCPLDDLSGIVIVELGEGERTRLIEYGFVLAMQQ